MISLNKYNFINEIKLFHQNSQQLDILLNETKSSCKDLLQQISLQNAQINFQLNRKDEQFINYLSKKKICFIIIGQNNKAKSLIANEILSRQLLPVMQSNSELDEFWRIVRIKHGHLTSYTLQLVETEFEIMSSDQLNKKFTFTGLTPPTISYSSSNSYYKDQSYDKFNSSSSFKNSPTYGLSVPIGSSSNIKIPLEDLQLGKGLLDAYEELRKSESETETTSANLKIEMAESSAENQAILEISLENSLLEQNVEILIHSKYMPGSIFETLIQDTIPIYLYGITTDQLNSEDIVELKKFQKTHGNDSIFFVKIPENAKNTRKSKSRSQNKQTYSCSKKDNVKSQQRSFSKKKHLKSSDIAFKIFCQLHGLNYLNIEPIQDSDSNVFIDEAASNNLEKSIDYSYSFDTNVKEKSVSEFCEKWEDFIICLLDYMSNHLKDLSVKGTTVLYKFHDVCLGKLINFTYEMVRDTVITPGKIKYTKDKEQILFESLNKLATIKQEELVLIINDTISSNREAILNSVENHVFQDVDMINYSDQSTDDLCIVELKNEVDKFEESCTSIESCSSSSVSSEKKRSRKQTVKYTKDYKKCIGQINELVMNKINIAIGTRIADTIEVLKEKYIGTLQRCLKSLEDIEQTAGPDPLQPIGDPNYENSASKSLQEIINSAYEFDINLSEQSNMLLVFVEKIKELFTQMPWISCPVLDKEWKILTAANLINSISATKLSKVFCTQMKERLKNSHQSFSGSIKNLESKLNNRLEKNEDCQRLIRKLIAPKFAKLSLESASLRDYLLYGFPHLSKEIGRGQYGVVYSCAKWGNYENLAIKSVVPPDEKHWNDLALEFHYSKQIAEHENIVKLLGTVIDYTYGNGQSPAILFIMERMKRDLHIAIKMGLDWRTRLNISIDIVEGIRYLHSRGLVHRDIKLKNVLLDGHNKAKLTDLGFCKPNAMISGSIVGTPVHMSPEVFDSKYDSSVDIYAFGILFWYICAGSVHLPKNFEGCNCKDDLWNSVKKGLRPERLAIFSDELWDLMSSCWAHEPRDRPHIGDIANDLKKIRETDVIKFLKD